MSYYRSTHTCFLNSDEIKTKFERKSLKNRIIDRINESMLVSKTNPTTRYYLKSDASIKRERFRHIKSITCVCIHPLSEMRWYWESFLSFIYMTYFIFAPLRLCFGVQGKELHPKNIDNIQLAMDIIFSVDIAVSFNTGYTIETTKMIELEKKNIIKYYLSGYFLVDVFSSFPFDYIVMNLWTKDVVLYIFFQLKTIVKFLRYPTFLTYSANFIEGIWPKNPTMRFRGVFITFLIITHVAVCLHNLVGTVSMNLHIKNPLLWHNRMNLTSDDGYIRYHYGFIFTMSNYGSSGYGRLPPMHVGELIIFVLLMLVINIYKLYLCVFLMEEVMGKTSATNQNLAMLNQIEEYMRHKQLPLISQKKFLDYYDFRFQNKYFREDPLMDILSDHLCGEILIYTCRNLVMSDLFKNIPKNVVGAILGRMQYEVYLPNDVIIRAGSIGDCMYFISSGTVAVYTPTGREVCHLTDGDYFGEAALIMKDSKRVATVMSLEMTELYCLDQKDFRELVVTNPELLRRMEMLSTSRINKTILLEEVHRKARGTTLGSTLVDE